MHHVAFDNAKQPECVSTTCGAIPRHSRMALTFEPVAMEAEDFQAVQFFQPCRKPPCAMQHGMQTIFSRGFYGHQHHLCPLGLVGTYVLDYAHLNPTVEPAPPRHPKRRRHALASVTTTTRGFDTNPHCLLSASQHTVHPPMKPQIGRIREISITKRPALKVVSAQYGKSPTW